MISFTLVTALDVSETGGVFFTSGTLVFTSGTVVVVRAQFERVLFLNGGAVGRIRHDHRLTQVFRGLARIFEDVGLQLLKLDPEERELILVHVVLLAHLEKLGFGQRSFRRHLAYCLPCQG